jgi:hypothetical protein
MRIETTDSLYADEIKDFFFQEYSWLEPDQNAVFESLSRAVLGTKQLRNGPLPRPEMQVQVRDVLRRNDVVQFFVPWGSSKQTDDQGFDVLDLCAIRQLEGLRDAVRRCGKEAVFTFRVEDLTDLVLFGERRRSAVRAYRDSMRKLASRLGPVKFESDLANEELFAKTVRLYQPILLGYLNGHLLLSSLQEIGWKGEIPQAQRRYYTDLYSVYYPGKEPLPILATYFASSLAKVKLKATGVPDGDFIQVNFTNPVPFNPIHRPRVHYRSIPERHTHVNRAPWIGKGYLLIEDKDGDVTVTPKAAGFGEDLLFVSNRLLVDGLEVECDYVCSRNGVS